MTDSVPASAEPALTIAAPVRASAVAELAEFHRDRESAAVSPRGNLALVNTQWVDVEQPIYGVPGRWSPLPAGESGLRLVASATEGIVADGEPVVGEAVVRGLDSERPGVVGFSDTVHGTVIAGEPGSYALRVWDAESEGIGSFGSIDRFVYNPSWVIVGTFTPDPGGSITGFSDLGDSGVVRGSVVAGTASFDKDGYTFELDAFATGRTVHLLYTDRTSGDSTYGVGRVVSGQWDDDSTIVLDFNRSVLPPCAFSYNFNCPIPPVRNRLPISIDAGEKNVLKPDGSLLH